jgi:creatinine amidohydrolase
MSDRLIKTAFGFVLTSLLLISGAPLPGAEKPLVLQEMTWTDVRDYLKTSDMVIIPLGSTEQHGPHMPLGTDEMIAFEMAKMISARTGVVVAPVVLAGYSLHHLGFPGTLSLKPETLEEVLYETADMLIRSGFRRIMFFNFHGGNVVPLNSAIHRVNHTTEAMAVAIGAGSELQRGMGQVPGVALDEHAGVGETSMGLYFWPELVHMDRAEKPEIHFSARTRELMALLKQYPQLAPVFGALIAVPESTKKGGSSREISSNGVWTSGDPKVSTRELGEKMVKQHVDNAVKFIEAWKKAES